MAKPATVYCFACGNSAEQRPVRPFVSLAAAENDAHEREDCQVFDVHGLLWSVPLELNVHQVNDQMLAELERMRIRPFVGVATRPHVKPA